MYFHPNLGVDVRQVTDNEYELWMAHSTEKEVHQFVFAVFPNLKEYSTRDFLFDTQMRQKQTCGDGVLEQTM